MQNIVIVTIKEWNIQNYFRLKELYKDRYTFHLITSKEELNLQNLQNLNPLYIFFPHWSWIIKDEIYKNFRCIVFHMTDLPFGRGGSPLQNLIIRGIYKTKISAIRVDEGIDSGEIYLKEQFDISLGSAQEIYIRLSDTIFNNMIPKIILSEIKPKKQKGKIVVFKRREPKESNMSQLKDVSISKLYDFIRMLDADGYPKAYLEIENLKVEFSEVHMKNSKLIGRFEVINNE